LPENAEKHAVFTAFCAQIAILRRRMVLFSRRAYLVVLLMAVATLFGASAAAPAPAIDAPPATPAISKIVELHLDGEVEPLLAEYIVGGIAQANADNAGLILITVNTPGGLDTSMREIVQAVLGSRVPVAIFVSPTGSRAASAGFFILMSADVAAMSPGTETGAASPLLEIGGQCGHFRVSLRHGYAGL